MTANADLDLVVVGGDIGGVICLKYARDAGLNTLLVERRDGIGGAGASFRPGRTSRSARGTGHSATFRCPARTNRNILHNIEAWVERFNLSPTSA
jgi:predicted NAD/FAD-dependent oxidoreductase